jgi:histidine triad (HIT) family protein
MLAGMAELTVTISPMEDSIFTKIIKGEIPSHKVYEDDRTYAFLDIHPVQEGMVLVVPKAQIVQFMDLGDEDYAALWQAVKKVAQRLREVYPNKRRIGVQVEGLDVDHVHVKLFPIDTGEEFRAVADPHAEPDHTALAQLANKLAF